MELLGDTAEIVPLYFEDKGILLLHGKIQTHASNLSQHEPKKQQKNQSHCMLAILARVGFKNKDKQVQDPEEMGSLFFLLFSSTKA